MDRQEFIENLERLGYPRSEYMILSGGSMLLRGLREQTADIDLTISEKLAESIDMESLPKTGKGTFAPCEYAEIKAGLKSRSYDIVDGYKCQTLEDILALKRRLMRPKDIKDIEVIEAYLAAHR